MTATDQLRALLRDLEAKARQADLDTKVAALADQADQYLQRAATSAGEFAHDNRERIDDQLARAGAAVDGKTEGKYATTVAKVRAGVLTGVDWLADQRDSSPDGPAPSDRADAGPTDAGPTASDGPGRSDVWSEATTDAGPPPAGTPATDAPDAT